MTNNTIIILSIYSFLHISDLKTLLPMMLLIGKKMNVKGTLLIATEGFNGYLSGTNENVYMVLEELIKLTKTKDINIKTNYCWYNPFKKFKVKIKKEIISMGVGDLDINTLKGEYIDPHYWDQFISRDDVIVIDTRNDYEIEVGTFNGSINPYTKTFKEFPNWVQQNKDLLNNRKVAMYCTGGVRCEKSTAYLKTQGFNQVYHLKGGILQYLNDTKNINNLWEGKCFVFDDRQAVNTDLSPTKECNVEYS